MLHDPEAGKRIVKASLPPRRPKDYDGRGNDALDSHADKRLPYDTVHIWVPITEAKATREMLVWMKDVGIPRVLNEMARESTNTSKLRVVQSVLHHWSKYVFRGWGGSDG